MLIPTVGKTLAILLCVFLLGGAAAMPVAAQTAATSPSAADDFIPEIPLPGLFEGAQKMNNNLMANYIRAMFVYFVWVVGIVATTMVVYGGIKWVGAAGNPGQIKDARDIIDSAVIGVIIALTSIVLLNIINPKLTSLNITGLNPVVKINADFNDANGCYENIQCPTGMVRAQCEQCYDVMGSGCTAYAPIDRDGCAGAAGGSFYGVCCRNADSSQCTGISGSDLAQKKFSPCHPVSLDVALPTGQSGTLDCGVASGDNALIGLKCATGGCLIIPTGKACTESAKCGKCILPGTSYTFSGSKDPQLDCPVTLKFVSTTPCGATAPGVDIGIGPCNGVCSINLPKKQDGQCTPTPASCLPLK